MAPLDWLIIGGGLHGTHLAIRLLSSGAVAPDRLRILDDQLEPFAVWRRCTRNTGMTYLRSPLVHHIDREPFGLRRFARTRGRHVARFLNPYQRPALDLFDHHCQCLLDEYDLRRLRLVGRARSLCERDALLRVETEQGALEARNVVLALGMGDRLCWPLWARDLRDQGGSIAHVFAPTADVEALPDNERVIVIGGGITAAQLALRLARRRPGRVTLLTRHAPRISMFDSDPGWLGPRYMRGFAAERRFARRRQVIDGARQRGSIPPELDRTLRRARHRETLAIELDAVVDARAGDDGGAHLLLESGGAVTADRVLLATGFESGRPGGTLVDRAIDALGLPLAPCGFPIVDAGLRWHPRLRVTGALAELELGPVARNIAGAREAATRIAP